MVLKKILKMFAIFTGSVIDSSFCERVFGTDEVNLLIEIKSIIFEI